MRLTPTVFLLAVLPSISLAATLPPAPVFPAGDTINTIQGVRVKDPYRALENGEDPKVKAWSELMFLYDQIGMSAEQAAN